MALEIGCFGKLPFYREFLRVGPQTATAAWVVRWVEAAHAALSRTRDANPTAAGTLAFVAPPAPGRGAVAGMVRESTDGLRRHPVTLFAEVPAEVLEQRWHLAPMALVGVWSRMRALLGASYGSTEEFARRLREVELELDPAAAATAYGQALDQARPEGAWATLTGTTGEPAQHMALNFLAVGRAQAEARSAAEGVAFSLPLPSLDTVEGSARVGCLLELFGAVSGTRMLPTVVIAEGPGVLHVFHRPIDGGDLAVVLGGTAPRWDELAEPWQVVPPPDPALAATLQMLVSRERTSFAGLLASVERP